MAGLVTAAVHGMPVAKRNGGFVLSTGERLSLSQSGALLIRQGRTQAFLPLPRDVIELVGVDEEPAKGLLSLKLGRACSPDRRLTLTRDGLSARLLLALERGRGEAMLASLRKAVALAPNQADLRLRLLRGLIAAGQAKEAEQILVEGMRVTPFDVAWLARQDAVFAPLVAKLPNAKAKIDLAYRSGELPPTGAAWSPSRRLAAFVDESWNLRVASSGTTEVFMAELALGRELDESGRVVPSARKAVVARIAAAEAMLGQLEFQPLETDRRISAERGGDLSWVRWKERGVSASAGNTVIRVRQGGKVVFEEKIDTEGTIALDWGVPLPEDSLLLLAWSRASGSDTCPNGAGVSQVVLPGQP
jgi:hypothetical protein